MKIPVLMITWNRLEYTKRALTALMNSDHVTVYIVDNGSTDGTREWLADQTTFGLQRPFIMFNRMNMGIAHAMNTFLNATRFHLIAGKVDNDTIVPKDWALKLQDCLKHCDIVQAKHHIIPATHPKGWKGFTAGMKRENGLVYNHYVGGSGILFKRTIVTEIPETENKIMGWRKFQEKHPKLRKAFCEDVEIKLLDEHGYTDYPEYYKQTGRI